MKRRSLLEVLPRYGTLGVCLLCYAVAFAQSRLSARSHAIESYWFPHATVVLAFMAAVSLAIGLCDKRSTVATLLLVRLALYYVLGPVIRDTMGMKLVLITSLILEAGLRLEVPENVVAAGLGASAAILLEGAESGWRLATTGPTAHGLLPVALYSVVLVFLASALRGLLDELGRREKENDRLALAVTRLSSVCATPLYSPCFFTVAFTS